MGIDTCTEVGGEGHPHSMKKLNKKEDPRKGEGEFHKIVLERLPYTHNMQFSPALRAARTEQPAVAEMPTHPFVHPATRLKP